MRNIQNNYEIDKIKKEKKIIDSLEKFKIEHKYYKEKNESIRHIISYKLDNFSKIGSIKFTEFKNISENELLAHRESDKIIPHIIYIEQISVDYIYRNRGIAKAMYKEFGKIYKENFEGIPIARMFNNPIAEYIFHNVIKEGFISNSAFCNNFIDRLYSNCHKNILKILKNKQPTFFPEPIENYIYQTKISIPKEDIKLLMSKIAKC